MDLTAMVAARLRARAGWTREQAWVRLDELGALLADVACRLRDENVKVNLAKALLPPPAVLLDRLQRCNDGMFSSNPHTIVAVSLALPAWAGLVAERGWVSEAQAQAWQDRVMRGVEAMWQQVPASYEEALTQRLLIFAAGEGRSREAWLR